MNNIIEKLDSLEKTANKNAEALTQTLLLLVQSIDSLKQTIKNFDKQLNGKIDKYLFAFNLKNKYLVVLLL